MDEENKKATKTIECSSVPSNATNVEVIESTKYRNDAANFSILCKQLNISVEDVNRELNKIKSFDEINSGKDVFVETISDSVKKIDEYNSSVGESLETLPKVIMDKAEEFDKEDKKYKCDVPVD